MGQNINPGANSGFTIQGRPDEFNNMIKRDGQLIRLIHAKKCSCIKNGKPDLWCNICNGKGYDLFFQEEFDIFQENSPHGIYGDLTKINPFYIPITKIRSVQRRLHSSLSSNPNGLTEYTIDSFNNTEIKLIDNGDLPLRYERIQVTYSFRNYEEILNEDSIHSGSDYKLQTIGTEFKLTHIPDALNVHGDIISISRVYNVTQDYTYTVLNYKKNIITLDDESGSAPIPLSTDILEVDYRYIPVFYAILLQVKTENAVQKWGEDVKIGDVRIILPGYCNIDRGSIITAMTTILQTKQIVIRGSKTYDELPSFDVFEIIGNIEDEDGNEYNSTHFELQDFNNLVWLSATKPTTGKKYSINYSYRPSYQVYRPQSKTINLGKDGRYPITTFGRFFNKFNIKDFDKL